MGREAVPAVRSALPVLVQLDLAGITELAPYLFATASSIDASVAPILQNGSQSEPPPVLLSDGEVRCTTTIVHRLLKALLVRPSSAKHRASAGCRFVAHHPAGFWDRLRLSVQSNT